MTILPRFTFNRLNRYDRSRRAQCIWITVIVGLVSAAIAVGMIYFQYRTAIGKP